jgi:2-phosphosulfolactate phosphatase
MDEISMSEHVIRVHNLPRDVDEWLLAGSVVVVIDVLRATTTICQALAAGATEVVPFLEVEEARAAAAAAKVSVVLGGERAGGRIAGFDVGNSPSEYTPAAVGGRRLILTTTNGTRALDHARLARRVLVGAFVNLSAVVASILKERQVDILCAGTDGGATREDILAAGAMASRFIRCAKGKCELNVPATAALQEWETVVGRAEKADRPISEQLTLELRDTPGGQNLLGIGLDIDLIDSAQIDRLEIVPELNVAEWRITVPSGKNRPC